MENMIGRTVEVKSMDSFAFAYDGKMTDAGFRSTEFLPTGTRAKVKIIKQWEDDETGWIMHGETSDPKLPKVLKFHFHAVRMKPHPRA
jgi:hypothetical protein